MILYKRHDRVQPTIEVDFIYCDRCGATLRRIAGLGHDRWTGGRFAGILFPESRSSADILYVDAEICEDCQRALIEWIDAGAGPGARVRDEVARAKEEMPA